MSLAGRLLVATPPMNDPNFERSVVLMLSHDADGAFGLVISRPAELSAVDEDGVLNQWVTRASEPTVFFEGGPVQQNSIIGLARFTDADERSWTSAVGNGLHTIDLESDATNALECAALRLFVGYSGWGPAQLDGEIAGGAWFVVDAHADDPFDAEPSSLWRRVLERDPTHREWVRSFPDDHTLN
jgi:putative transcriptional regulator